MKAVRLLFILIFFGLGTIPLILFNFEKNSVSKIDNRVLQEMPVLEDSFDHYFKQIRAYVEDRIGLREEMIQAYADMNMNLFRELNHPNYEYGQDGHLFAKLKHYQDNSEYVEGFVQFIAKIQQYCEERGIKFLFAIEPQKSNVYPQYLPVGYVNNKDQIDYLFKELQEKNIRYLDNIKLLQEKADSGEQVFNVAYDVDHWNNLGALYGINNIMREIGKDFPAVEEIDINQLKKTKRIDPYLPISKIRIDETNTYYEMQDPQKDGKESDLFTEEIKINKNYPTFGYSKNTEAKEGMPDLLLFRGSYFTGYRDFLKPQFRDLVTIHNYQNIIDFEYYINVFQPDYVVFETVEYVFLSKYFDLERMKQKTFNPGLNTFDSYESEESSNDVKIKIAKGEAIANLTVNFMGMEDLDYAYLQIGDQVYDMNDIKSGQASLSIALSRLDETNVNVIGIKDGKKITYGNVNILYT